MYVKVINYNPPHRKRCKQCVYFSALTQTCDYILVTGHSRGCDAAECDKFEPNVKSRKVEGAQENEELPE